jgi:hypothetical protein
MTKQTPMELSAKPIEETPIVGAAQQYRVVEVPSSPPSIEMILSQAVQAGRTGQELQSLLDLYERMQAKKAEQAFNAALAVFKRTCPPIVRRTENPQFKVTRNGVTRPSRFASLADIGEAIDKPLGAVGLGYEWTDSDTTSEPGKMRMGCIVRHAEGHVAAPKYVSFPLDTAGAGSSPQQKVGSVTKYCMRYSLTAALGLTDCDDDDLDGNSSDQGQPIAEEQQNFLNDLIIEVGADRAKFLKFCGVDKLAEIRAANYAAAVNALESKRKAAK